MKRAERLRAKRLKENAPKLLEALKEIAEGKGPYSMDRLKHADNTIQNMIKLAKDAIALVEPSQEIMERLKEGI